VGSALSSSRSSKWLVNESPRPWPLIARVIQDRVCLSGTHFTFQARFAPHAIGRDESGSHSVFAFEYGGLTLGHAAVLNLVQESRKKHDPPSTARLRASGAPRGGVARRRVSPNGSRVACRMMKTSRPPNKDRPGRAKDDQDEKRWEAQRKDAASAAVPAPGSPSGRPWRRCKPGPRRRPRPNIRASGCERPACLE